jgi:hypothetical protein
MSKQLRDADRREARRSRASEGSGPNLFDPPGAVVPAEPNLPFGGTTYEPQRDRTRLKGQLARVADFMGDGKWHTVPELAAACECSETSASARLRDLRKTQGDFPGLTIVREYVSKGLWRYRMVLPK